MVQKAKLDILEDLPALEITEAPNQTEANLDATVPVFGQKWAFNKFLLLGAPVLVIVLVISGVLWFYLSTGTDTGVKKVPSATDAATVDNKKSVNAQIISKQTVIVPVKINEVYFKDFIIDLKDKTGKSKILMCDVAVNVNTGGNTADLENRKDIRNLIYQAAAGKNVQVLRLPEERNRLKTELLQEINKLLGDGVVKDVYFTNYVIM